MGRPLALGVLVVVVACARDHGTPRVRPLPAPDQGPALRGGGPPRASRIANYRIEVTLDPSHHQLTATQTLTWTNVGASAVDTLPFHLYLNAFKNEASVFMQSARGVTRSGRTTDGGWGWIEVRSVQVGGAELVGQLAYVGPDETVAELTLPQPVAPGATIEVRFAFTAQLPEVFARTGYQGEFHLVAQWFPKIGVRHGPPGAEHWDCPPLHVNSEFFADFGTYDVAVTVPSTYVVAATGVLTGATESPGGTRTLTYRAEDVHDFVWMADPYMEVLTGQATVEDGTVEVRVVHRPAQRAFARRHLDAAIGAIERFSAWLVPYPWPIMTIVDPPPDAIGAGAMEYPTLVTTAGDTVFAPPGVRLPEYVTVHEVGHNWFQGMLASHEAAEAWLDEGVNDWADANVMAELYGPRRSALDWMGWQAEITALVSALATDPASIPSPIATAAHAFVDPRAYAEQTYTTTARALATLEQTVGPQRFAAAIKVYARTWAFEHPTGSDLFEVLSRELGQDLTWFFGPVFHQVGGMRLGVRTAACRLAHPPRGVFGAGTARQLKTEAEAPATGSYTCEVVVTNTGTMHVPLDIELKFRDGSTQRVHWDDRGQDHWERFVIERSTPLAEVWLDPDNKLALASPMLHHVRVDGDGSASLRAAAWLGHVTQSLMQIVGP